MSKQHIEKSKATVEAADHIPAEKKAELLESLEKLKPAIAKVSQTHKEDAQSIARLLDASTQEATRKEKRAGALKKALDELKESIQKFEASHPKLVELVGEYSTLLANMGL
jgi:prefoldin subunit 5